MSVYNGMPYLKDAVNAVLSQTVENFEFVIVNDGSTDETKAFLDDISDPRIRIIHQENKGLGKPLNKWMKQCQGEYIMRVDADDICHPMRIEKQLTYLEKNSDVILLGCQYQVFSDKGKGHVSTLPLDNETIVQGMLNSWHTISHPTIMFRQSLLNDIDGYSFSGPGEDWSLLLDAARYGKLAVLPDMLYYHRLHHSSNAWKGASATITGLEYAKKRYQSFKDKKTEYSDKIFLSEWNNRSWFKKQLTAMKAISAQFYREAILNKIEKKHITYYYKLLIASIFDLNKTIGAITKKINIFIHAKALTHNNKD